jgi:hypothetical protein
MNYHKRNPRRRQHVSASCPLYGLFEPFAQAIWLTMAHSRRAGGYKPFEDLKIVKGKMDGLSYLQIQAKIPHRSIKSLERRFHFLRNSSRVHQIRLDLFLASGDV